MRFVARAQYAVHSRTSGNPAPSPGSPLSRDEGKPSRTEPLRPFPGQWEPALLQDAALAAGGGRHSGRIAQLVEQLTLNQRVPGSSPGAPTNKINNLSELRAIAKHPVSALCPQLQCSL